MKKKILVACLCVALAVLTIAGTTLAYLTATTQEVKNTFTVGNVDIALAETTGSDYHIVPGQNITKDPKVTVNANSENCWLFVKVIEANWPIFTDNNGKRLVNYAIADGWTALDDEDGVYYREVNTSTSNEAFAVLKDNQVTVSGDLTKEQLQTVTTNPTLTFTAYAIQKAGFTTVAAAWAEVSKPTT